MQFDGDALEVAQKAQVERKARSRAERTVSALGEQTTLLSAIHELSEELASERRISAERESIQQDFNRRMSWAALLLAGAAVVVPFGILLIEQGLR